MTPPEEEKSTKGREETHQLLYVVTSIERDDKHVVKRSGSKEQRTAFSFFCRCCIVTLVKGFVKPFSQFVCYSSVARDELNAIYRIRNSGMQVCFAINQHSKFDTQ